MNISGVTSSIQKLQDNIPDANNAKKKPIKLDVADVIVEVLLYLPVSDRHPVFLMQMRREGHVLKKVAESDVLWREFTPKAAQKDEQSRCSGFIERLEKRSVLGNSILRNLYTRKDRQKTNALDQCRFGGINGGHGEDPDLGVAHLIKFWEVRDCGEIVRNDKHVIRYLGSQVAGCNPRSIPIGTIEDFVYLPSHVWTSDIFRLYFNICGARNFGLSTEMFWYEHDPVSYSAKKLDLIPKRFWREQETVSYAAQWSEAWPFLAKTLREQITLAESAFSIFIEHGERYLQKQYSRAICDRDIRLVFKNSPEAIVRNPARLEQLASANWMKTISQIPDDLGSLINSRPQLERLVRLNPRIYFDLVSRAQDARHLSRYADDYELLWTALQSSAEDNSLKELIYKAAPLELQIRLHQDGRVRMKSPERTEAYPTSRNPRFFWQR